MGTNLCRHFDFKSASLTFLGFLLLASKLSGITNLVTGTITTNTTWSGTNLLQGTVAVTNGVLLTIDPGTTLLMNTGATLIIYGQLLANGQSNSPITFTRATTAARWSRIRFLRAADSRLQHCVVEYANSAGTHLDYYDNDCNSTTPPPARVYHEAIVAVATHLDIEGSTFQNLPDSSSTAEGDAIAIISDDPVLPGIASANIRNCRFISIGQGIHSRYSPLLVENCFFTGKRGDNDDVDLYGESIPVPLIRNNIFLNPGHDDMINPTKCSAIIMGNLISGSDDHGIVLRDKCYPIVMNNVISNCASGGIAIQNQCDALLINNTIVDCGIGLRFFDHDQRWGSPYCLTPGSGKATIINCIIWDCPTSISLADSPYTGDRGSHAKVYHSNIEGGQASTSVSANSTLLWGAGNISIDPQFTNNLRLRSTSPSIDTGTNASFFTTNLMAGVTNDYAGLPRPLDGNGDGVAAFDMGAFEFLLPTADSNGDGIPDGWVQQYGFNPIDPTVALSNPDQDPQTTFQEWVADTNPTNALSYFNIADISNLLSVSVSFQSSTNRQYTLLYSTAITGVGATSWTNVPGQDALAGNGGTMTLSDTNSGTAKFYRVEVTVP